MTKFRNHVLDILEEICESGIVKENPNVELFEEGILDSFCTISLLVEFEERFDIKVSTSDFDRDQWKTPNVIVRKLEEIR
ncbi:D-alanine--poly(phosphoribitol) ligase subunit DltC [Bacillus cereus group sp. BfR-BA-01494]|uniref:D-alanine--poly(phosphoribitol) ligase subunit DltC n=1 Tax=Bacillus cereus group sp. BfR-BA-01494 TaxID=2920362 RepID=UPI001F592401